MSLPRGRAVLAAAALVSMLLPAAAQIPAMAHTDPSGLVSRPPSDHEQRLGQRGAPPAPPRPPSWLVRSYGSEPHSGDGFTGLDGSWHARSPVLVQGQNGTTYYGGEMDAACGWGKRFERGVRSLSRLASVIEASGRRVLFTIGPNKSAVNTRDLPVHDLPHGECDLRGIRQQNAVLDSISDPAYLPMRRELSISQRRGQPMYWSIDTHWGTLSTTLFSQRVADRLSPRVARAQSYARLEQTIYVDLNYIGALQGVFETQRGRVSTTDVKVVPAPDSTPYAPDAYIAAEHRWSTSPARRTIRGRTLILGDSFAYRALGSLMPLFRHGTFQWYGVVPEDSTLEAIRQSDTVILEVVQRSIPVFMTSAEFRHKVARALRDGK